MSQPALLIKVIRILNTRPVPYMLTGSIVSSIQGEPRSTHDIDIVISIDIADARFIAEAFPEEEFYCDSESIRDAILHKSMFNIIDLTEGDKIDFWLLTDEEFDRSRFSRKHKMPLLGEDIWLSSPEDTILAKLRWSKLSGGSRKHFIDALKVYEIQYPRLDLNYLADWVKRLGVSDLFSEMKAEAVIVE